LRGDVYEFPPRAPKGHQQAGDRYGVVVQNDSFAWNTVVIAPTSASAKPMLMRPQVQVGDARTVVMVDQLQSVDPELRLGRKVGRLSFEDVQAVDEALRAVFDL
jgi:mRNA interferase MazF